MCGIAGIIHNAGIPDSSYISDMLEVMQSRGPDSSAMKNFNGVWLGHSRLSIIDLFNGQQPMETRRYVMVFNGEIYNYKDLRRYVHDDHNDDAGTAPQPPGDARTLVLYLERFGLGKTLRDINGMFAIGLYDKQEDELHMIVDRLGQKPLYFVHKDGTLKFASVPSALTIFGEDWNIDEYALQSYWTLGGIIGENSLFSGINRVNAGEIVTFSRKKGKIKRSTYWWPEPKKEYTGLLEDLIFDSIQKTKVSDVPVYVLLSGGVDSTLVASQCKGMDAAHLSSKEVYFARKAAEKFDIRLNEVLINNLDPEQSMRDYVRKSGEPAMSALQPYIVSKAIKTLGGKVAITANGADELFYGYNRTSEQTTLAQRHHMLRNLNYADPWIPNMSGQVFELMCYVQFDLNATLDRASMCHGVEVRSPFLDHRLIEAALSIPESQHRNGYGNKSILKKMLLKMGFDKEFVTRKKMGFSFYNAMPELDALQEKAFRWAIKMGFLTCDETKLSGRDRKYLQASAFSFYHWFKEHEEILH